MDIRNSERKDPKGKISEHAVDVLERVIAEASKYSEVPDRNCFLMCVTNTLVKAILHLSEQAVGPGPAANWVKVQLEALGPLLSSAGSRSFQVLVTIR